MNWIHLNLKKTLKLDYENTFWIDFNDTKTLSEDH